MEPIVDVAWLEEHHGEVVLADVRWYLDGRSGRDAYQTGHIAGAVFVPMNGCLAAPASAAEGRHPLPHPSVFASCMGTVGIGDRTVVVGYDDARGSVAARLVWMLRALGEEAALLDGGLDAWTQPLETGPAPTAACAGFTPRPWPADRVASIDDVGAAAAAGVVVVDVRAPERYRGDVEPIDPRAGHIPGAVNVPWFTHADFPEGELIVHCGSGVNACHTLLALERAGRSARLFPGSWSQWSADPSRPVAIGP